MTTPAARKITAGERRSAWLTDVMAPITALLDADRKPTDDDYQPILDRIAAEGPALGRGAGWGAALASIPAYVEYGFGAQWVAFNVVRDLAYAA